MSDELKKEQLKELELMKEILIQNMQINYETYCELLAKINILSYHILKDNYYIKLIKPSGVLRCIRL